MLWVDKHRPKVLAEACVPLGAFGRFALRVRLVQVLRVSLVGLHLVSALFAGQLDYHRDLSDRLRRIAGSGSGAWP